MKKTNISPAAFAAALVLTLSGCGSESATDASTKLSGVVSADQAISVVFLKDASTPAQELSTEVDAGGAFTFEVAALRAPYVLRAKWMDGSGTHAMYSVAHQAGTANINALTDAAVARSAGEDPDGAYENGDTRRAAGSFGTVLEQIRTVLKPLFDLYRVTNPATDEDSQSSGLRTMLRDVGFSVRTGTLTVTNRQTGGVIFSGPVSNLASGTFNAENLPSGDGVPPPAPATCTSFTYAGWSPSVCPSSGQQARTVATSSPSGCTGGSPVLAQSCTPPPAACNTCHAIPPGTGKHAFHQSRATCTTCHGTGYSSTTVNAATHNNGVKNVASTQGWNATARTCANSCHGTKTW
jgi:hypothetical protein